MVLEQPGCTAQLDRFVVPCIILLVSCVAVVQVLLSEKYGRSTVEVSCDLALIIIVIS